MIAIIRSEVATGRRMKMRDGFMSCPVTAGSSAGSLGRAAGAALMAMAGASASAGRRRGAGQDHLGAVLEAIRTFSHDDFADSLPVIHRDLVSLLWSELHRP